jgi:hypothetical protein
MIRGRNDTPALQHVMIELPVTGGRVLGNGPVQALMEGPTLPFATGSQATVRRGGYAWSGHVLPQPMALIQVRESLNQPAPLTSRSLAPKAIHA